MLRTATSSARSLPVNITNGRRVQARYFLNIPTPASLLSSHPQSYAITKTIHNCNAALLFDIVSSIDQYQTFIPFLHSSFVSKRDQITGLPLKAGLIVGWKGYDEQFICDITTKLNQQVVAESVTAGDDSGSESEVFEFLRSEWNFSDIPRKHGSIGQPPTERCRVDLKLNYQFKNPLYNSLSSLFNQQITEVMIKAFEARVRELQRKRQVH